METPAVSVIVPVYKAEKYLHKCVDSILAQTFRDFEVLLVDDGSPDRSGTICDEYAQKDPRVRVFHKENGGVSSARQCGLDHAQGEYTIHADPDDWVEPNMLEELYAKAKAEDADMVICDYYVNDSRRQRYVKQQPSALDHETVLRELFQQLHGSCWNKLVRRACYRDFGVSFPLNFSFSEDLYVNVSLVMHTIKIAYVSKGYYHYVQFLNENSIVNRKYDENVYLEDLVMRDEFSKLLQRTNVYAICMATIDYARIRRAFFYSNFSAKEFQQRFRPYVFIAMKKQNITGIEKLCLYLSCSGMYRLLYRIYALVRLCCWKKHKIGK